MNKDVLLVTSKLKIMDVYEWTGSPANRIRLRTDGPVHAAPSYSLTYCGRAGLVTTSGTYYIEIIDNDVPVTCRACLNSARAGGYFHA